MKKILIVAIALLMLSACTKSTSVPKTDVGTTSSGIELVFSSHRQGNIVIYYPSIKGLADTEKQDRLNEKILNDAKNVTALFDDDIVFITVDYEVVARSDEKIVIEYTGHGCSTPDCDNEQVVSCVSEVYL